MRFYDMKKITVIASLLVVFTACKKVELHPNNVNSEPVKRQMNCITPVDSPTKGSNSNSLGSGTSVTTTTDSPGPITGNPSGGEITDPLRKKDQKDNK
jgi:hypothetical protein